MGDNSRENALRRPQRAAASSANCFCLGIGAPRPMFEAKYLANDKFATKTPRHVKVSCQGLPSCQVSSKSIWVRVGGLLVSEAQLAEEGRTSRTHDIGIIINAGKTTNFASRSFHVEAAKIWSWPPYAGLSDLWVSGRVASGAFIEHQRLRSRPQRSTT